MAGRSASHRLSNIRRVVEAWLLAKVSVRFSKNGKGHRQRQPHAPRRRQMMSDGVQRDVPGSKSSAFDAERLDDGTSRLSRKMPASSSATTNRNNCRFENVLGLKSLHFDSEHHDKCLVLCVRGSRRVTSSRRHVCFQRGHWRVWRGHFNEDTCCVWQPLINEYDDDDDDQRRRWRMPALVEDLCRRTAFCSVPTRSCGRKPLAEQYVVLWNFNF